MIIWGSLFLLTVGFVLHVYELFYMAAAWGLVVPLGYLLARINVGNLQVARSLCSPVAVGDTTDVTLTVHNRGRGRRFLFTVEDLLPEGLTVAGQAGQLVTDLAPEATRQLSYQLIPERRGVYQLSDIQLAAPDLLGMYELSRRLQQPQELIVYPRPISLPPIWRAASARGAALTTSRRKSHQGTDLYGVREYIPGDDLRHIHWKVSAHANQLIITEREERRSLAATVILDLSRGAQAGKGNRSTLEYGVTLAVSLLVQALSQHAPAQLIAEGRQDFTVPSVGGGADQQDFLEALARVQADNTGNLRDVARRHQARLSGAGSVAVITPQVGTEMLELAAALRSWSNAVSWFALAAPTFDDAAVRPKSVQSYDNFVQALRRGGCQAYLIRGDVELAGSFRRWQREAV